MTENFEQHEKVGFDGISRVETVKGTDIKELIRQATIEGSEREIYIYDTSRTYEQDGEWKAPLLAHYIIRDSVRTEVETISEYKDTTEIVSTDSVVFAQDKDIKEKVKKVNGNKAIVFSYLVVLILLLLVMMFRKSIFR